MMDDFATSVNLRLNVQLLRQQQPTQWTAHQYNALIQCWWRLCNRMTHHYVLLARHVCTLVHRLFFGANNAPRIGNAEGL
jgi:hypothetical protein